MRANCLMILAIKRRRLVVFFLHIVKVDHLGPQVSFAFDEGFDVKATQPLDQHLGFIVIRFGHLENQCAASHLGEVAFFIGADIFLLFGNGQSDDPVAGHGFIDQLEGIFFHHHQGQHHFGEKGRVEQRQYGDLCRKIFRIVLYRRLFISH
jgi:hypothetical protein